MAFKGLLDLSIREKYEQGKGLGYVLSDELV